MRSGTITHQVGRKCEIQTSRANSRPKLSKTITSEQRSSGKLSETVAGTGAHNVGSTPRTHVTQTDHRQCTDEMDLLTCSMVHPSFQEKRCTVSILSSHGWSVRGKLLELGESVLAHLPEVGKGSGNPAPKLADRWSDLTDEHQVRTDEGVVYARSVRRLAEHSWSEENPEHLSKHHRHHRSRRRRLRTSPPAAEPLALPHASQEVPWDDRRKTKKYGEGQWTQKKHQECRAQA